LSSAPTPPEIAAASVGSPVEATSFAVLYELPLEAVSVPTDQDYSAAAAAVQAFLRDYFVKYFDSRKRTTLFSVTVTALGNTGSGRVGTGFDLSATFSEASKTIPTKSELDVMVQEALSTPSVDNLVELLNNMVSSNPIASVDDVSYSAMVMPEEGDSGTVGTETNGALVPVFAALAGVFALCVAGFGATVVRRRRMVRGAGSISKDHIMCGDKTTDNSSAWVDGESGASADDASRESFENFVRASIQGFDASSSESGESVRHDP
jgi:hypothetical protein